MWNEYSPYVHLMHYFHLNPELAYLCTSQRISAKDALDAEYFWTDPRPADPQTYGSSLSLLLKPFPIKLF